MSWKQLLAEGGAEAHRATRPELEALRGVVARNLRDAALPGLSADNRFGLGYEAAPLVAKMAVLCAGYRIKGTSAHRTTFTALALAMGRPVEADAEYFDRCRRKRNVLSYEYAGAATESEANDVLERTRRFERSVEDWIARGCPELAR